MCFDRADGKLLWQRDIDLQGAGDHPPDQPVLLRLARDRRRARDRQPRLGRPGLLRLRGQGTLALRRRQARTPLGQRLLADPARRPVHPVVRPRRAAVPPRGRQEDRQEGLGDARSRRRHGHHQQEVPRLLGTPIIARVGDQDQLIFAVPVQAHGLRPEDRQGTVVGQAGRAATATPRRCSSMASRSTAAAWSSSAAPATSRKDQLKLQGRQHVHQHGRHRGRLPLHAQQRRRAACYEWKTGKELWKDQIDGAARRRGRLGFAGPRRRADLHHRPARHDRSSSPPGRSTSTSPPTTSTSPPTPRSPSPAATSSSARTSTCGASGNEK